MKSSIVLLLLSISNTLFAQDTFQLAPPLLKYGSVFFMNKAIVEIKFAQSETEVHYTFNKREPTINDKVYKMPISIKNNFVTLKAKAFGNNFHPSETVRVTFIKEGKAIQSIEQTAPNAKYPGTGVNTLTDNKGGIEQLSSNTWMGYNCDTFNVKMTLKKQQTVNRVLLNFLQSESGWVFLPNEIIVKGFNKKTDSYQLFGEEKIPADKETSGSHCKYRIIEATNKLKTDKILIHIIVKKNIPEWHSAKGEHGWMFIDEIKVY
jgi:hypothetical protein